MTSNAANRLRLDRGQSLVETVVMLPVLLMIFLGLDYFFELTAMRARAIEAARYMTWESSWYLRDNGTQFGADRPLPASRTLNDLKIDRFLVNAQADAATRKVADYNDDVGAKLGFSLAAPRAVAGIVVPGTTAFDGLSTITGANSGANSALSAVSSLVSGMAGIPGFFLLDLFARETNWKHEADRSIFTARVEYKSFGINYFHLVRPTDVVQFSSILSHPLLIVRTDDKTEYEQLVGANDLGDCFSDDSKGHIFDLWFAPTGDPNLLGGVGSAVSFLGNTGKCMFASIGSAFSAFDSVTGSSLGFRVPDGTLMEFPERR